MRVWRVPVAFDISVGWGSLFSGIEWPLNPIDMLDGVGA